MLRIKYFLIRNKLIIMVISILIICSIAIAIGVYAQITDKGGNLKGNTNKNQVNDYKDLKDNFKDIFTNRINKSADANLSYNYDEILYCAYDIVEEKAGEYNINAKIPLFKVETDVTKIINKEIFDTFGRKILDIVKTVSIYRIYNLDYVAYVNDNIISLIIRCNYKDGSNPLRTIIQTYNYDFKNDKKLSIDDILNYKRLNKDQVQEKINNEIKEVNKNRKSISSQGYNLYIKDENDKMYKIENTANYFLGQNNYLYLVYAYGNNDFTNYVDLIIF